MANPRTGRTKGYAGQRGGAHQIPWREDREILARIAQVRRLRAQHLTIPETAQRLGVSTTTVSDDIQRDRELAVEDARDARDLHVANLHEQAKEQRGEIERIERLLAETSERSLNVSGLVGQIQAARRELRALEMDAAKLDGSLVERQKVDVEATLHNGDRSLDLLRPEVRDRVEALYDALDGHADAAPAREADRGRVLALPPSPSADRASPSGGDGSA